MTKEKKVMNFSLGFLIIGIVVGFLVYSFVSNKSPFSNQKDSDKDLQALVDSAYPKPPADIRAVVGKITAIDTNTIRFETADPEDYLPHKDGSAQKMITRTGKIISTTEMYMISPTKVDSKGNIPKKKISVADLKVGDSVTITGSQNIRTAAEFDVLLIEKIEY